MNFNSLSALDSSKRSLSLSPLQEEEHEKLKGPVKKTREAVQPVIFDHRALPEDYEDDVKVGSKRGRNLEIISPHDKGEKNAKPDEGVSVKPLSIRLKVPNRLKEFQLTAAKIVNAKIDKVLKILEKYKPVEKKFLESKKNKKDVVHLHQAMKKLEDKLEDIDQQFPDGKLLVDPNPNPLKENRFALLCEGKKGQELFAKRGPESDLIIDVYDPKGDLIASEFAHREQLAPWSTKFEFKVIPNKKPLLHVTFEGSEEDFRGLLFFLYTGKFREKAISPAVLLFAKAYGIKEIISLEEFVQSKKSFLQLLFELRSVKTLEEFNSHLEVLFNEGFCENPITRETLSELKNSISKLFRNGSKESRKKTDEILNAIQDAYLVVELDLENEEDEYAGSILFDSSRHTKSIPPFLQSLLTKASSNLDQNPSIRKLGFEESSNYCIEPSPAAVLINGKLSVVTVGIVCNELGTDACFYLHADPLNETTLQVKMNTEEQFSCPSLKPGQTCFFSCDSLNPPIILLEKKLYISNAENDPEEEQEQDEKEQVVFPSLNSRKIAWVIASNKLAWASKLEQSVVDTIHKLATISGQIKQVKGLKEVQKVSHSVGKILENDLKEFPCKLRYIDQYVRLGKFIPQQSSQVNLALQCPSTSVMLQEIFPRNTLAVKSAADDNVCRFSFNDGKSFSTAVRNLEGRMICPPSLLISADNKTTGHVIPLDGAMSDLNNQFLIEYLTTNCILRRKLSVEELSSLIIFGEYFDMTDFVDKLKLQFLHRSNLIDGNKGLKLETFRIHRRNQQYDLLNQLVSLGGYAKSTEFIERIQLLQPEPHKETNEKDQKLILSCIEALCNCKEILILEAMNWAKSNDYTAIHKEICRQLARKKKIQLPDDYLQYVLKGHFNRILSYNLSYSDDLPEFFTEFTDLYQAYLNGSKKIKDILEKEINKCLKTHFNRFISPPVDEDSFQIEDADAFNPIINRMLPAHIVECIRHALSTENFSNEESQQINLFLNFYVTDEFGLTNENVATDLINRLNKLDYTKFTTLENFVMFAKLAINKMTEKPFLTAVKFRSTVIAFTELPKKK